MEAKLQNLLTLLQAASLQPKKKKRNKRKKASAGPSQPLVVASSMPSTSGRKRRRNRKGCGNVGEGEVVVRRREKIFTIKTDDKGVFSASELISPLKLPWAKSLAAVFERVAWRVARVHYKAAVGSTIGGLVACGVDWGNTSISRSLGAIDRDKVMGLTPFVEWTASASNPSVLVLPPSRLMSRAWYDIADQTGIDSAPGYLVIAADSNKSLLIGEVYLEYEIVLSGTKTA